MFSFLILKRLQHNVDLIYISFTASKKITSKCGYYLLIITTNFNLSIAAKNMN
ncbi:MAG: hypothetical protein LBH59_01860 [Planctomycetaceae bacterium]|nr:hypothetical protein [Planctomycetaceae bacterium]